MTASRFVTGCLTALLAAAVLFGGISCAKKAQTGAVVGAGAGAAVGSMVGSKSSRTTNILIGAGIGLLLGYIIGNEWDKHDQEQMDKTLEHGRSGEKTRWVNPDTGNEFEVTPGQPVQRHGRVFRKVDVTTTTPQGRTATETAEAYRKDDGTWQFDL
jgi:surface antigen